MAKVIDITDKLSFEENPKLVIRGQEIEVISDAATILKIMQMIGDGENVSPNRIVDMYNLIIPERDREKINSLNLKMNDFQTVVMAAINLVTGDSEEKER